MRRIGPTRPGNRTDGLRLVGVLCLLLGLLVLPVTPGAAQSAQPDAGSDQAERLTKFERDIMALQQRLQASRENAVAPRPAPAVRLAASSDDVELRLNAIEKAIQQLTGMAEENTHRIDRLSQRLDRLQNDLTYRVEQLEAAVATEASPDAAAGSGPAEASKAEGKPEPTRAIAAAPPAEKPAESGAARIGANRPDSGQAEPDQAEPEPARAAVGAAARPNASAANRDPDGAYAAAFDLLRRRDFDGAETAFTAFIADFPEHPLTENAHYWLGETHYARGQFEAAARSFASGYKAAPDGRKAPDNLLKLGLSLEQLGRTSEACLVLQRLLADFPSISGSMRARVRQSRDEMSCS